MPFQLVLQGDGNPSDPNTPPPPDSTTTTSSSSSSSSSASAPAGPVGGQGSNIGTMLAGIGMLQFAIVITNAAQAVNLPGRTVSHDEVVEISPNPANAQNIQVATTPSDALNGPNRLSLTPGSAQAPRNVNVGRLNELWIAGAVGDSLLVVVRKTGGR